MNDLIVDVKLWGESVGSLYWEKESNAALFDYERKFIRSGLDISPIIMPISQYRNTPYRFLENRTDCFKGLPGLFADSLPDTFGNQIINEWFASKGLSEEEITPLDRLCYVGKRGMGALEFEPSSPINGMNESSVLHIEELTELAKFVFTDRMAFQAQLRQEGRNILDILKVGTSAGGAKPKAIIAYNDITGEVRSGQVKAPEGFGYWLLKFDGGKYSEHTQITDNPQGIGNIEYAYHRMAKACGIDMMECRLFQEKESCHFMTRRFDRMENGEKIHVQTLAGLAHYDRDQRHSYEEIFRIMRQMNLPYPSQEELYRRMVFNVMGRNHDDHSKNFSFLMNRQGKWKLSPAYDLCYSYTPGGKWTNRHQLSLNGKQDNFTMEDLQKVGENMGIREHKQIIEKVQETVSHWHETAKDCGVKPEHADFIGKSLLLFGKQLHTIQMPDIANEQEQAFMKAMRNDDFNAILELKMKGYQPSEKVLKILQPDISATNFIAAAKIFQMEGMLKSLQDIKPVQSPIIGGNKRSMELGD
jgi:serine/threonine-protein kinase HipA